MILRMVPLRFASWDLWIGIATSLCLKSTRSYEVEKGARKGFEGDEGEAAGVESGEG